MIKNSNNRIWVLFKSILQIILLFVLVASMVAVVVGAMLGISMVKVAENAPKIEPKNIMLTLDENSKIYDKDGNMIESIAYGSDGQYRELIKYEDIPQHLIDAFISIEDERFLQHNGIDLNSIARSIVQNISSGGIVQGGSTITQQLVKNVYLTNDVKWERKITEMYLALKVESELSKEEILEAYINKVFLGQHSYGVEAAAETYFSKSVKDLNLAQQATLASIVQAPDKFALFLAYPPASVPEDANVIGDYNVSGHSYKAVSNDKVLSRKNLTLNKMLELGKISQEEYEEAKNFDLIGSLQPASKLTKDYSSHIAGLIKKQAIKQIMKSQDMSYEEASNLFYTGGLSITTTIDWDVQEKLEATYNDFAKIFRNTSRSGRPIFSSLSFDSSGDIISNNGQKVYVKKSNILTKDNKVFVPKQAYKISENGDLTINSSRIQLRGRYITFTPFFGVSDQRELISYRIGSIEMPEDNVVKNNSGGFTIKKEYFDQTDNNFYEESDNGITLNSDLYTVETVGTVQPQSSTVILDSKTAEVVAMVSRRGDSPDDTIDRATNYTRSPASSIKPIAVYAPALEEGRTLADPADDTPHSIQDGRPWPKNFYNHYKGIQTTRKALLESQNASTIKIFDELGMDKFKSYMTKFGIIDPDDPENDNFVTKEENPSANDETLSAALGGLSKGLTTMDVASAYQTFANKGERIESSIISKISSDSLGDIYVNEHKPIRVISEENNFLISDVMHQIANQSWVLSGLGNGGMWTAGKTGTSSDGVDVWFAGYNHYYTAATWIGFDNQNLSLNSSSGEAGKLYYSYMNKIVKGLKNVEYEKPASIETANVSAIDGLLPSELTSRDPRGSEVITEYFAPGTVPKEVSKAHVLVSVDRRNGLLAPEGLPEFLVAQRVFVKRPVPYNPAKFNGIVPTDWKFEVPTKVSNLAAVSTTNTEELEDGTIIKTTNNPDGSIIEEIISPDGTITRNITDPDGNVTTSTEIPNPEESTDENPENEDSDRNDDNDDDNEDDNDENQNAA